MWVMAQSSACAKSVFFFLEPNQKLSSNKKKQNFSYGSFVVACESKPMFSSMNLKFGVTVAPSFLFGNYCSNMD